MSVYGALAYIAKTIDNVEDLPDESPSWHHAEVIEMLQDIVTELGGAAAPAPIEAGEREAYAALIAAAPSITRHQVRAMADAEAAWHGDKGNEDAYISPILAGLIHAGVSFEVDAFAEWLTDDERKRALRPAPAEAGERACICTPAIAGISDGPNVDCPEHGEAGEREALFKTVRRAIGDEDYGPQAWHLVTEAVIAAGFRRAPIEDAEPVAYEVQVTGEPGVVARVTYTPTEEQRATARPLYAHPSAPIEVTDEAAHKALTVFGDLLGVGGAGSDSEMAAMRAALTAAFKEMNR